jgi:hypothetical protein
MNKVKVHQTSWGWFGMSFTNMKKPTCHGYKKQVETTDPWQISKWLLGYMVPKKSKD